MVTEFVTPIIRRLHRHSATGKSKARSVTIPGDVMKGWEKNGPVESVEIYVINGGVFIKPAAIEREEAVS